MDNNAWFPDFDIPIPLPPSITAEICLCFDSYLSVEGLDEMIGLPAKCAEPRGAMGSIRLPGGRIRDTGTMCFRHVRILAVSP